MAEWRLFDAGKIPEYTQPQFFAMHGYVDPNQQTGNPQRLAMTARLILEVAELYRAQSFCDLGCNDGGLIRRVQHQFTHAWGYDMGDDPLEVGQRRGLDVRKGNILSYDLQYGDLTACSEVIEHLLDPHSFIRDLPVKLAVFSSPWRETPGEHYMHHAWAWDVAGYREMFQKNGWYVLKQVTCFAGFQAIGVARPDNPPERIGEDSFTSTQAQALGQGIWPSAWRDR